MKLILFCIYFLLSIAALAAQTREFKIVLLGDAGNFAYETPINNTIKSLLDTTPYSACVLLGDNIYFKGYLNNNSKDSKIEAEKMLVQLRMADDYKGYFYVIPGNHDWRAQKWNGYSAIKDEAALVEDYLLKNTYIANRQQSFFPTDALPGPSFVDIDHTIRLIFLDTQWFLQKQFFHKVGKQNGHSQRDEKKYFYQKLDSLLKDAQNTQRQCIIMAHHPLITSGAQNRVSGFTRFLINYTPLQLIGIVGLNRLLTQDIEQPRHRRMVENIKNTIEKYKNTVYASGHEHLLCYKQDKTNHYIISGAGSKKVKTNRPENEQDFFKKDVIGFAVLTIGEQKFKLQFYDEKGIELYQTQW